MYRSMFLRTAHQKERLAQKTRNNVMLCTYASYLEVLDFIGKKKLKFEVFPKWKWGTKRKAWKYHKQAFDVYKSKVRNFPLTCWFFGPSYHIMKGLKTKNKSNFLKDTWQLCFEVFPKAVHQIYRKGCRYPKRKGDVSKSKFKIFLLFVILCTVVP